MNLDGILSTFSPEMRESASMKGLVILIQTLVEQLTKSQEKIKVLEDELAKLRKTPKRPKFRPNGMQPRDRDNGSNNNTDKILPADNSLLAKRETSEVIVKPLNIPDNSRFKGYQTFAIQDISLIAKEIIYKLEVWQSPNGDILRGKLPEELKGQHFGSTLRAFATNLYAQGMTQPAVHEFLRSIGIDLSSGQINHILLNEAEAYSSVSEAILSVGLQEAPILVQMTLERNINTKAATARISVVNILLITRHLTANHVKISYGFFFKGKKDITSMRQ